MATTKTKKPITFADLAALVEDSITPQDNVPPTIYDKHMPTYTINNELTEQSKPSEPAEKSSEKEQSSAKRVSQKQRKSSLEEYKNCFLSPPKITDRKTVYLSKETHDRLDEIVRRLGERGSSVSGFIENMAKEHLDVYRDEIDLWKRL